MSQCLTLNASKRLLEAAERKCDERVLLQIRGKDLIAIEVKYHKSCYGTYTRERQDPHPDNSEQDTAYDMAFQQLVDYVDKTIIKELDVIKIVSLRDMYIDLLSDNDVEAPGYRTEKLKARLIKHYGDQLTFWRPQRRTETEFVYSSSVSTGQAVEAGAALVDVDTFPSQSAPADPGGSKQVFKAAAIVRGELGEVVSTMPWPPKPEDLDVSNFEIPGLLYNLIAWIVCGDNEEHPISSTKVRLSE